MSKIRFWKIVSKNDVLALRCFSWNPYLKTDGGSCLVIFSVKDPKQQSSVKILFKTTKCLVSLFKNHMQVSNLKVANTHWNYKRKFNVHKIEKCWKKIIKLLCITFWLGFVIKTDIFYYWRQEKALNFQMGLSISGSQCLWEVPNIAGQVYPLFPPWSSGISVGLFSGLQASTGLFCQHNLNTVSTDILCRNPAFALLRLEKLLNWLEHLLPIWGWAAKKEKKTRLKRLSFTQAAQLLTIIKYRFMSACQLCKEKFCYHS